MTTHRNKKINKNIPLWSLLGWNMPIPFPSPKWPWAQHIPNGQASSSLLRTGLCPLPVGRIRPWAEPSLARSSVAKVADFAFSDHFQNISLGFAL